MTTLDDTEQGATVIKCTLESRDPHVIIAAKEQGEGQGEHEGKSRSCISALTILAVGNMATHRCEERHFSAHGSGCCP